MKVPSERQWQQINIQKRLDIIERTLQDLDKRKVIFKKVTYLARHLADEITLAERQEMEQHAKLGIKISTKKICRASSLLKSSTYRPRMDLWIRRNNNMSTQEGLELAELRFKLIKLSNEHDILLDELRALQEIHGQKSNSALITTERNEGMTIAQMVINHFKEFCEIHGGALIEPSPGRPVIVPANLFSGYLNWAKSLYH